MGHESLVSRDSWRRAIENETLGTKTPTFPFLSFKQGMRVLDIGCGTGSDLNYLHERFDIEGVGIDIALSRRWAPLQKRPKLSFLVADASYLPFRAEAFD